LAEAEVELGNLTRARELVNMIRNRAANPDGFVKTADGLPAANYVIKPYADADPAFSTAANARTTVRFESRLELGMEGHRFFDLARWGIADQVMNAYYAVEKAKRTYFNGVNFIKGKHEYYPIPLQEIVNSQKGGVPTLKQNPNY